MIPRLVTANIAAAEAFYADTLARGHEGVMLKALDTPYDAGSRGAGWLKGKRAHTLDLVVLAAEWGHGRRRGWLSNLHLGARDAGSGGFVMPASSRYTLLAIPWTIFAALLGAQKRPSLTRFIDRVQR